MKKISTRFALMMAAAAVVPLLAYGAVSIWSVGDGAQQAVKLGNQDIARRVGAQIHQYVLGQLRILKAVAGDLNATELATWQQRTILRNYVLDFDEFRELTLLDDEGRVVATSGTDQPRPEIPGSGKVTLDGVEISPFMLDDEFLPTATAAIRVNPNGTDRGWLVGRLRLEELWKTVDGIRIGETGYALVVTGDGQLVATGEPDSKSLIALRKNLSDHPVVRAMRTQQTTTENVISEQYEANGHNVLGVGAQVPELDWTVIVEQPTREAFAISTSLQLLLILSIAVALLAMLIVGALSGRRFIQPILQLTRGTRALADGHLDTRVAITSNDELGQLGTSFNTMADRLVELQEDVRKKERHAMFGRMAIGLVHDLSHPIMNLGNYSKLMLRSWDDAEFREAFRRTMERELAHVRRVLDDLLHVAKPRPVEHFPIDVNKSLADLVDSMESTAANAGLSLTKELTPEQIYIEGDLFALNRVYRNLIMNAIQATNPRGRIIVRTSTQDNHAIIEIADSGFGIPAERLETIFDDFVTTKRRGLGLGLAISKKVVEQLGGTIAVTSQVGVGSTFSVRFPLTAARPSQIAAM